MIEEVSRPQETVQMGQMTSPEQSLDLKAYQAGLNGLTGAARLEYIGAHPAESAALTEKIRRESAPTEARRQDRIGRTGQRYVFGIDGKVYPGSARLPGQVWANVLVMRRDGYSMRKIGAAVGCSVGTVHRVVKSYSLAEGEE